MAVVDWTDPCARAAALRNAYYRVISGDQEAEIETRTGEAQERVKFSRVDVARLKAEWEAAEAECQAKNGITPTPRRSAIRIGAVGVPYRRGGGYC